MLALIDADIVVYRIGFTTENEDFSIAKWRTDELLDRILHETSATEFQLWLSDRKENNYRFALCSKYKATRPEQKPRWHEEIKEYLITKWGARFAYGQEADDALGIAQTDLTRRNLYGSIICSIDKDLQQIEGNHYNFVKQEKFFVTELDALRFFYSQFLIGDTSDNIQGCRGIGPVKAGRILLECTNASDCLNAVVKTYKKQHPDWPEPTLAEHLLLIGRLLKIRTEEDEPLWDSPLLQQMMEVPQSLSTQQRVGESTQSTEPCGAEASDMDGRQPVGQSTDSGRGRSTPVTPT